MPLYSFDGSRGLCILWIHLPLKKITLKSGERLEVPVSLWL
jgi:hypothetical protein